ncbi:glutathione S-transferase family protein [Janthinobacterium agaricidamnosum]|uniref:Glutathione S-transferase, C-terminal domain protein n=1 Tax=Janthinobacterium agaricidamnosum NBRC 102515 = DSM 9628 TaxID=1349767 RepID=W0VBH9_9BURK|nr:glutathione S-transferase [Janthinobacterium agaricidamnosum]CDG84945.1 glutathione S-transferase, C-terminal domain protein [Janthinobacterium agaricidamnosum NBRC 102515 = DSM 9628]
MLKILGKAASINVRKVLWTCEEIGVPFEREDWGAGFRSTGEASFVQLNPNAMVPVILDDDFVLWESNAICRYLSARHGRDDLLPAEPKARALVEQWMDWQLADLNNSWRYAFMSLVKNSPAHQDPADLAAGVANWNKHIGILERHLAQGRAFVAGDSFTLADVVLGLSVNRWLMTPITRPDAPAVAAYYERLSKRPGFLEYGRNGLP